MPEPVHFVPLRQGTRTGVGAGPSGKEEVCRRGTRVCHVELRYQALGGHCVPGTVPSESFIRVRLIVITLPESRHLGSNLHSLQTRLCDLEPITAPLWTSVPEGVRAAAPGFMLCQLHCSPLTELETEAQGDDET